MKKLTFWIFIHFLGFWALNSSAQNKPVIMNFSFNETSYISNISDNGLWGVAYGADENNSTLDNYPYLFNVQTGEIISLLTDEEKLSSPDCSARDVTDDGRYAVGRYNGKPAFCIIGEDKSIKWRLLPTPTGLETLSGYVSSVSPDGKYMAGTMCGNTDNLETYSEHPVLWIDGEVVNLENMPTTDARNNPTIMNRIISISADGNIILGCLSFIYPGTGLGYYVYNVSEKSYQIIALNEFLYTGSHIDIANLSCNGEWVSGSAHLVKEASETEIASEQDVPFRYHVKTKTFEYYDTENDYSKCANIITNQGFMTIMSPVKNPLRAISYRINDYYYDLSLILKERYGINFTPYTGFESTGTPVTISSDGRTIGVLVIQEGNYVITFPEDIEEAASSVNLLANSYVAPEAGSSFSSILNITVTFEKAPTVLDGTKAELYEDGTLLRNSISIEPINESANCKEFNVNFRRTPMKAGSQYTVKIPAGTFRLGTTSSYNKDIEVSYIGRADKPVSVTSVNLEDGMEVATLSYNSPILMQFDTQLSLNDASKGVLYQEGIETPVADLTLAISSNMLAAYPIPQRNLFRNVNYTVKIPAGSVMDIMGNCANEEIVYNYKGAYTPEPPADTLLFYEDFSDEANAYSNFMRYEGDHNTPSSIVAAWNFDADNTPWYFGIRESNEATDYCAASTSMYTPAGTSNDWMVTHQIHIPSSICHLTFDAQSYLSSKEDYLKVYIWANEGIYSALSGTTIEEIEKNGTLIFNQQITSGDTEEGLEGEWQHFSISLADYADQYIYIAFVNQNSDQSSIFIDNIKVTYKGTCQLALTSKTTLVNETETTISGMLKITDETKTYNEVKIFFSNEDKTITDTITDKNVSLKNGSIYDFTFSKKLPLIVGKENRFTIGYELEGDSKIEEFVIKNLSFAPEKRIIIEEGTGAWCTYCPDGIVAIEHISQSFPGQIIPICIHYNDVYDMSAYTEALNIVAFPNARVNRNPLMASAFALNKETYSYNFTSASGNETMLDFVLQELETEAEAGIEIDKATFDKSLNRIDFKVDIKYALDKSGVQANLFNVVLEDDLYGNQSNGRANFTDPIFGEWGKGGKYGQANVQIEYQDVARAILCTTFDGTPGLIPATVSGGEEFSIELGYSIPENINDLNKMKLVSVLIDNTTGRVINAAVLPISDVDPNAIEKAEGEKAPYARSGKGAVHVTFMHEGNAEVMLYNLSGMLINHTSALVEKGTTLRVDALGQSGIFVAKIIADNNVTLQKIIVK